MQHIKESTAYKALAEELAQVATKISHHMAVQVLKCKCLNNADKQQETLKSLPKA